MNPVRGFPEKAIAVQAGVQVCRASSFRAMSASTSSVIRDGVIKLRDGLQLAPIINVSSSWLRTQTHMLPTCGNRLPNMQGCWTFAGGHGRQALEDAPQTLWAHAEAGCTTFDTGTIRAAM